MCDRNRRSVLKTIGGGALIGVGSRTVAAGEKRDLKSEEFILSAHEEPFHFPHPECGDYSDAHDFIGDQVRWPSGDVGYEVSIGSARSAGISPNEFQSAADKAFDAWDEHADDIRLVPSGSDISVKFGGVDGKAKKFFARAITTWNEATNEIVNSSILLEPGVSWKVFEGEEQCPTPKEGVDAYDVQSLLAHEIGHALGLAHPPLNSENRLLTMYPVPAYRLTYWRSPDGGDITGIQTLYGES